MVDEHFQTLDKKSQSGGFCRKLNSIKIVRTGSSRDYTHCLGFLLLVHQRQAVVSGLSISPAKLQCCR